MRFNAVSRVATLCSMFLWATCASAGVVIWQAGVAGEPTVVFEVDQGKAPKQIAFKTERTGVAGSVFEVLIDNHRKPILHHIFTEDECRFVEQQSFCEVSFSAGTHEFAELIESFIRGRKAHVTIVDAGVMKMDHVVSLEGVARRLRR